MSTTAVWMSVPTTLKKTNRTVSRFMLSVLRCRKAQ